MDHPNPTSVEDVVSRHQAKKLQLDQLQDALDLLYNDVIIPHFQFVEMLRVTSRRAVTVSSIVRSTQELSLRVRED